VDQHSPHSEYQKWIRAIVARAREATSRSFQILKLPAPDTFLGRKTQEPFPKEDASNQRG